jgi:hypothetical protein
MYVPVAISETDILSLTKSNTSIFPAALQETASDEVVWLAFGGHAV